MLTLAEEVYAEWKRRRLDDLSQAERKAPNDRACSYLRELYDCGDAVHLPEDLMRLGPLELDELFERLFERDRGIPRLIECKTRTIQAEIGYEVVARSRDPRSLVQEELYRLKRRHLRDDLSNACTSCRFRHTISETEERRDRNVLRLTVRSNCSAMGCRVPAWDETRDIPPMLTLGATSRATTFPSYRPPLMTDIGRRVMSDHFGLREPDLVVAKEEKPQILESYTEGGSW